MILPTWTIQILILSVFFHGVQLLMGTAGMCDDGGLPNTEGNAIDVIQSYASFEACVDPSNSVEQIVRFALFTIGTLPFLLILAAFLFDLFNNAVTGTVVGALAVVAGLILVFS